MRNNTTLLTIICVALLGILGLIGYQVVQEEREPDNPVEAIGQAIEDAGEDMQNN